MFYRYSELTFIKSSKFALKGNRETDILEKITTRHSFTNKKIVEILLNENFPGTSND